MLGPIRSRLFVIHWIKTWARIESRLFVLKATASTTYSFEPPARKQYSIQLKEVIKNKEFSFRINKYSIEDSDVSETFSGSNLLRSYDFFFKLKKVLYSTPFDFSLLFAVARCNASAINNGITYWSRKTFIRQLIVNIILIRVFCFLFLPEWMRTNTEKNNGILTLFYITMRIE